MVTIKGRIGAVPICFEGLKSRIGCRLYRIINGERNEFDQSVHDNDFWQTDYDAATNTYKMTFNLPLDGLKKTQWLFTRL